VGRIRSDGAPEAASIAVSGWSSSERFPVRDNPRQELTSAVDAGGPSSHRLPDRGELSVLEPGKEVEVRTSLVGAARS
jgi:hypothetical protein